MGLDSEFSDVGIIGRTDDTLIGNVNDKLKVTSDTASQIPNETIVYSEVQLLNGGSKEMNVNGSVTPVTFENGPPAGLKWYIYEIGVTINDLGTANYDDFGTLASLTNGVLVEQYINSTAHQFRVFQDNGELASSFGDHHVRGVANAFISDTNFFTGNIELRSAVTLDGDNGDKIRATVRDNLTGLVRFRMSFEYFKVI